jgi:hypothetical protein
VGNDTRSSRFREELREMADEREPLLEYHEIQRERTEQLLSHVPIPVATPTVNAQEPDGYPVDYGKVAWMQVLGGFIVFANSW